MKNLVIKLKEINMKKNLLLIMLCCPVMLAAQNGVTVSNLAVSNGSPSTVTFDVSWKNTGMPVPWSDTVWVFVDYNNNGVMERLSVTGATTSAGTVTKISDNDKGVWIAGNARTNGSFSATVKLFTAIKDVGGACVYGSNYPPVGKYTAADKIEFTGTPEYKVVLEKSDKSTYTATVHKDESLSIPSGEVALSFIDKTGAPGMFEPAIYTLSGSNVCVGAGVTLTLSGSQKGWKYQLYKGSTAIGNVVDGTGSTLAFPDVPAAGNFNYTVWTVDNPAATAQRAMQVSNVRAITIQALPATPMVNVSAATVCAGTNVVFTATGTVGSTFTWSGAAGTVSGTGNGTYTVSGAATGTKSVTVYARLTSNETTCQSNTYTTVSTVMACTPPDAASTKTWTVGTQTWSDVINIPVGCNKSNYSPTITKADCRNNGSYGYLYSWVYVKNNASTLCPEPWHVPTAADFCTLDKNLNNSASCDQGRSGVYGGAYTGTIWGGQYVGYCEGNGTLKMQGSTANYWSATGVDDYNAITLYYDKDLVYPQNVRSKNYGFPVRCVK
jgi:uncharacterized protein (TIGR02145 family)